MPSCCFCLLLLCSVWFVIFPLSIGKAIQFFKVLVRCIVIGDFCAFCFSCLLVVAIRLAVRVDFRVVFAVVSIRFAVVLVVATLHNGIVDDVLECVIV